MNFNLVLLIFVGVFSSNVFAQNNSMKTFGDWHVIRSNDGKDLIAATTNQAGNYVGFRCFSKDKQCIHALVAGIQCDDGDNYPVLINSDVSSMSMDAICSKNGNSHELLLTKYDQIHEILMKGNNIGFAIPLGNGNFKAVRFSLDGSDNAMNFVESVTANLDNGADYF